MGLFGKRRSKSQAEAASASPPSMPVAPTTPRENIARLEATHPIFRIKAGMKEGEVLELLGDYYLRFGSDQLLPRLTKEGTPTVRGDGDPEPGLCWLYHNDPPGHDFVIGFSFGSVVSVEVEKKEAGKDTVLLARIDHEGLAAVEPYRTILGAKSLGLSRRKTEPRSQRPQTPTPAAPLHPGTGRSVEKIVILHAGDDPSQGELQALLKYVRSTLAVDTVEVPIRVSAYGIHPERITRSFGMMALLAMESKGEVTNGAASRAWVGEVAADGQPRVIIVVYKQAL